MIYTPQKEENESSRCYVENLLQFNSNCVWYILIHISSQKLNGKKREETIRYKSIFLSIEITQSKNEFTLSGTQLTEL